MQECLGRRGLRVAGVLALEARPLVEVVAPVKAAVAECAVLKINELHSRRHPGLCSLVDLLQRLSLSGCT